MVDIESINWNVAHLWSRNDRRAFPQRMIIRRAHGVEVETMKKYLGTVGAVGSIFVLAEAAVVLCITAIRNHRCCCL